MKNFLILMMIFMFGSVFSQQKVTGRIKDENGIALSGTTIININTDTKTYSDTSGEFSIDALKNDELRFIRVGYERISGRVLTNDSNPFLLITMIKIPEVIEEVKVSKKPTGDLETDSRAVAKA